MTGRYFTGRKTGGDIELIEWSKHAYHDAASTLKGDDFPAARPFVGWFRKRFDAS